MCPDIVNSIDNVSTVSKLSSTTSTRKHVPFGSGASREVTGGDPSSQYVYPGYVMIDVWAKAVERAKTTEAAAVVAELEKMKDEPTLFGPRTFTSELHHQNKGRYLITEISGGKGKVVDEWTISDAIPVDYLISK